MKRTPMFLAAVGLAVPALAAALDVPITVQSLAPDGVAVPARRTEPVSAGVPFAVEENIRDVQQLGMLGTSAAQFRVLQRDPESGNVTWALATFVASGGPYRVTPGGGAFGGAALATEAADRIVVTTGAARFEVRKQGFNVLDRVLVGADERVTTHTGLGVVVTDAGTRYESGLDAGSSVVIE